MVDFSIIYSLYGTFDVKRFHASVLSALHQENVNLEIIIAVQDVNFPKDFVTDKRLIIVEHTKKVDDYSPGGIRNTAAKEVRSEFMYMNDADIVFTNPTYLSSIASLLENQSDLTLMRPEMHRLQLSEFERFYTQVRNEGISTAISKLQQPNPYFLSFANTFAELKVVQKEDDYVKTFVALMDDFQKYLTDPSLKGKEPTIFYENLHIGGIATRRSLFEQVGGYCEQFENWGCEDSDLQWKLGVAGTTKFIPHTPGLQVLHLDHPKSYFNKEKWKHNEEIHKKRLKKDFSKIVSYDNAVYRGEKK